MSKKGGAQQLQADINTDEELFKFLEKPGLLVFDVYSEWCGPCLAIVGSLRKIKLELGGDNLHLAICKTDTIEALKRFRNKSEPTWLFATRGKLVNLMFGTDVPKLMKMIAEELSLLGNTTRTFYDITELQPEERARRDVIEMALADARRKEITEAKREKQEYLTYVTDEIMTNLPDVGVTIFGPHVVRDSYKKLMEVAETQKIQCKDRRTAPLLPEHFDIINFSCENPIEPDILEHMYNKDLLIGFWKTSEQDTRELQDIFLAYAHDLTHPRNVSSDGGESDTEQVLPPILSPLEIKGTTLKLMNAIHKLKISPEDPAVVDDPLLELVGDKPLPGEELEGINGKEPEEKSTDVGENLEEIASVVSTEPHKILVPPIWVPTDRRTHATLIYVFFRAQTATFLPPDPVPDPPHIVMAFDAYKKKDIFEVIAKNQEDVLLYGFFSEDNPESAKLIANTIAKYESKPAQITDKLVLKVAKNTSHTMLTFATYGPSYVSANTVVGKQEAMKFFPEGYSNQDIVETEVGVTKKKKKSKTKQVTDGDPTDSVLTPDESGEEQSGETIDTSEQQITSEN